MLVEADGIEFDLAIVPLNELRPHEATVPKILDSIIADLKRTEFQRDPILIDRKTRTVLDGMHRRASLEAAGAKFALCAEFDYLDDSIKLERWLRYFIAPDEKFLSRLNSLLHLHRSENFRQAIRAVDTGSSKIALLSAGDSYVGGENWNVMKTYETVEKVDELSLEYKINLDYTPDSSKLELFTSESVYLLYPVRLSKTDVLQVANQNRVLPCKTTRHVVPVRPMGVYFPLDLLKGSSESDCERELKNIVKLSKIELEKRQVWYEGRRYSEPLAIFRREEK